IMLHYRSFVDEPQNASAVLIFRRKSRDCRMSPSGWQNILPDLRDCRLPPAFVPDQDGTIRRFSISRHRIAFLPFSQPFAFHCSLHLVPSLPCDDDAVSRMSPTDAFKLAGAVHR
ncbi:hypothetical protein, partial [Mesorhizobium sp. M7A.F.Ca.ET.027.02.1.1]|uniref:hypothetical protein n=1 Tax=Mesorhizobium sp. M7A.F.Ca.ET.027.02.1.1 TaxID=2496655 RepID=UPI001AECBB6C